MHFSFRIEIGDLHEFIDYWSGKYSDKNEEKYNSNIGNPLTENSLRALFEWKNGGKISKRKRESIRNNYPFDFPGDKKKRYLNHKESGGAIWNIFYLHCLDPLNWPIFDQHTYRAMQYLKTSKIVEISSTNKQKYEIYEKEYIPFLKSLGHLDPRGIDKALFAFGQFLKLSARYHSSTAGFTQT